MLISEELAVLRRGVDDQTDLDVVRQVVEQDDLQQQLLAADNEGGKIQGQEEVLEDCELQKKQVDATSVGRRMEGRTTWIRVKYLHRRLPKAQAQVLRHNEGGGHPRGQAVWHHHLDV